MISFANCISKLFNFFAPSNEEAPADEDDDVSILPSTSVKRRPEENTQEEMIKKRKKLIAPASSIIDVDPCLSSYLSQSTISDYQKENQQMASDNLKINQVLRRRQKSPRLKSPDVYLIDDDECDLQMKRHDMASPSGMTLRSRNSATNLEKSPSSEDCLIVGETHRPFSRPPSVLRKVQSMHEQTILMKMFQNQCSITRRSIPLTNSTVHNTKLNRSVPSDTKSRSIMRRRQLHYSASSPMTRSSSLTINPCESAFDKTVINNVIDLTNDDDEDQRQAIESKVLSSSKIRNMKSAFVADYQPFALDENLITNLTQKYDAKLRNMLERTVKIQKVMANHRKETAESLSEILEKRLIVKEQVEEKEDVVHKPSMEIAPITKKMISEMNTILASRKYPLVQIKDTAIKPEDVRTLENTAWLNDEVINAYMNLIKMRSEENPKKYPKVHCFNTFLYEQLSKKGYASVRRWTRKVDIFDFDILIVPIHLGNHWCLTQIRFREKMILYYDSMGSPNNRCLQIMMQYLVAEFQDKKNSVFDSSNWTLKNVPYEEIPQQKNAYDCGVFACTFAEHLTRNSPLNFDQDHMQYFRYKMMYEILTGKLLL